MIREQNGKNKGTKLNMFMNQSLTDLDKSHKNICLFSGVFLDKSGVYPLLISHFHGAKAALCGLLTSITYIFIREKQ